MSAELIERLRAGIVLLNGENCAYDLETTERCMSEAADALASLSARVAELDWERARLLRIINRDPKTVMIAFEDGDHQRLSRGAVAAEARAAALAADNERLREALRPFADQARRYDPQEEEDDAEPAFDTKFSYGDFRRARAALEKGE